MLRSNCLRFILEVRGEAYIATLTLRQILPNVLGLCWNVNADTYFVIFILSVSLVETVYNAHSEIDPHANLSMLILRPVIRILW